VPLKRGRRLCDPIPRYTGVGELYGFFRVSRDPAKTRRQILQSGQSVDGINDLTV
jgi:hypothetical protein